MSEKLKGMIGSKTRGDEVKRWLISQGAINYDSTTCEYPGMIYYVRPNGNINTLPVDNCEELFEIVNLPRWRGEYGDSYYYLNGEFEILSTFDHRDPINKKHFTNGNYFRTREDAEAKKEQILQILLPKDE